VLKTHSKSPNKLQFQEKRSLSKHGGIFEIIYITIGFSSKITEAYTGIGFDSLRNRSVYV